MSVLTADGPLVELATAGKSWKRAVAYAFAQAEKRWHEDGRKSGGMTADWLCEWVAYYLAQQWQYKMPPGGLFP